MKCIMDLESDGLLQQCTKLHCAVFKDIETEKIYEFIGWSSELKDFLDSCTSICAHNGTTFDFPFLKKVYNWYPKDGVEVVDSLIMSRILNPDRTPVAGTRAPHSVEAWGKRLGRWKPDHSDWSTFSPEMLHRCKEDVEIQFLIYQMLCSEASVIDYKKSIFDKTNYSDHNWALALKQEHESAYIMHIQEMNGVYFEKEKAVEYVDTLTTIIDKADASIQGMAPAKPKQKGVSISKPFLKSGGYAKSVKDWYPRLEYAETPDPYLEDRFSEPDICGPFSRIEWNELNIGSEKQLKEWLYTKGWVPDEWNFSKTEFDNDGNPVRTSPKLTDTSLAKLSGDVGATLTLRSKSRHRRSQIEGWIGNTRDDHRLPAAANPQGTPTGRMRHIGVANVPSVNVDKETHKLIWYPDEQDVFFGTEMRSLFSSPEGRVLVGRDASGLELRMLAHYINDPVYTDVILNGDIHTHHQQMAGLDTRSQAKTFCYAWLYGAGFAKIGSIVLPDGTLEQRIKIGKELSERFLRANPKLASLIKGVKKASGRGWLLGLDGRKLMMRTMHGQIQKNKALNTLLQGAGALVMTNARIWLWHQIKNNPRELSGVLKVLDYHDEETWECLPEQSQLLREIMIESVVQAGTFYNLNCPLDADAKIGNNWAEVH